MARNKNTLAHLRSTTRGASLAEYTVLTGLLGAVALGAVLAFGINVQDNTETIQSRVDSVVALANGAAPGDGGSAGPGVGGGATPPAPTPPVDLFASCEAGYGPNAAAIRGNGDGSLLSGGDDGQIIYALANGQVDGGEGGADFDTLMVPGAGAVATFTSWDQPESGRVDMPNGGAVVFGNIERLVLCDAGGDALPPSPPPFVQVGASGTPALSYHAFYLGAVADLDPVEGNGSAENASTISNATFGSIASPLLDSVMVATAIDGNANGSVAFNTAGERFSFSRVLTANPYVADTAVSVNATLTFEDGTTGASTFLLGLFEEGTTRHLVLLPPTTTGPAATLMARGPVVSIQVGSTIPTTAASIGASRVDVDVWVRR